MSTVKVAATQIACSDDYDANLAQAEELVREAASKGANIILLQELFAGLYFCQEQTQANFKHAEPADGPIVQKFSALAAELGVVLPISFFEKANNAYYNSLVVIDADGSVLDLYRKSHIPDGPGYQEKFYFSPGDTGFKVWETQFGKIGVAICWDQWFPEAARSMVLQGAEILFYPTAIGSEPQDPTINSRDHWQRTMQGHSAANIVPVVASNRVGREEFPGSSITFYGSSFITDEKGAKVQEADEESRTILISEVDISRNQATRASWGLFRDRRPELYKTLLTLDGANTSAAVVKDFSKKANTNNKRKFES
uniref:CN hydrolase domain-containing protein n=1 Tax=Heterosigma akashiwo TaxID=2829 RepID=A0A6V3CGA1_HETAK|mmetsp:Transcript_492/g.1030  ORF Transcript_492/g.1030 Transcript_492/m.1030 type:complete len:312 (+) Transcript_492:78-1013(+)